MVDMLEERVTLVVRVLLRKVIVGTGLSEIIQIIVLQPLAISEQPVEDGGTALVGGAMAEQDIVIVAIIALRLQVEILIIIAVDIRQMHIHTGITVIMGRIR